MWEYYERLCIAEKDSPETTTPQTSVDVDLQEYLTDRLLDDERAMGTIEYVDPFTILRHNGCEAKSWGEEDLKEILGEKPSNSSNYDPFWWENPQAEEITEPSDCSPTRGIDPWTLRGDRKENTPIPVPQIHTRVQITQYLNGTYEKGKSGNFEVPFSYLKVFEILSTLRGNYNRTHTDHRVRIQLQNKVEGRMMGGKNLSLPGTTVELVIPMVRSLLENHEMISAPGRLRPTAQPLDNKGEVSSDTPFSTEDGSRKLVKSKGNPAAPTPNRHQTCKTSNGRVTFRWEMYRVINGGHVLVSTGSMSDLVPLVKNEDTYLKGPNGKIWRKKF